MIVQSFGALQAMTPPAPTFGSHGSSLNLYGLSQAYGEIYRAQPNVRICVDFLARNIAQLGQPVYRRISDTDRERLNDHDLATWLSKPNPATTRYRLIEDLMTDLGIYFRAYWLKVRYPAADGRDAIGLVRLPPDETTVEGGLLPTAFIWTVNGRDKTFAPSEIVHFSGYNLGISPLETLRRILAEEHAAGDYRESLWAHGAKHEGIWERDNASPNYTDPQIASWREQWQEFASSSKAGMTAVGQKGWKYVPMSFSSKDSEYIQGGKLRREICAAAYHIPQPMVGILEHATFSNIKEQHKHTYQDCLGPWLEMISQEIERQLLTECDDQNKVYIEFNIAAKLSGTPEEQIATLVMAAGKPIMTTNETRARLNLPRDPDPASDKIAAQQGGPSDASANPVLPADSAVPPDDSDEDADARMVAPVIQAVQVRQQARLRKLPIADRAVAFDLDRWNRELASDLTPLIGADVAARVADDLNTETLARLEADAARARLDALEQRPVAQQIDVHPAPAPITVHLPAAKAGPKSITLRHDATGKTTGADVVET